MVVAAAPVDAAVTVVDVAADDSVEPFPEES